MTIPSGAVLRRAIYWRLESYCVGVWGAAVRWFGSIWGGIVGVFSVVTSWFGGVFRGAWNAIVSVFGGLARLVPGYLERCGWYFGSVGVYEAIASAGAFRGAINGVLGFVSGMINGLSTR